MSASRSRSSSHAVRRPHSRAAGWLVHLYTASGLALAAGAAVLVVDGAPESLRRALLLLFAATAVDASDGWLARRLDVAAALPSFDGRRLDDIVDFHTYTSLPLFLLWRAGVLTPPLEPLLLLALLASAYGFSQVDAKTADGHFRGFPSYWNVVALYLLFLRPPPLLAAAVVVALALLTFVPVPYPYPSQPGALNRATALLGLPWAAALLAVLLGAVAEPVPLLIASLAYPAFYLAAGWVTAARRGGR